MLYRKRLHKPESGSSQVGRDVGDSGQHTSYILHAASFRKDEPPNQPQVGGTFAARAYEDAEVRAALRLTETTRRLTTATAGLFEAAYNVF